ncbi:MAG: hypothetical protein V1855_00375 [bacterium]
MNLKSKKSCFVFLTTLSFSVLISVQSFSMTKEVSKLTNSLGGLNQTLSDLAQSLAKIQVGLYGDAAPQPPASTSMYLFHQQANSTCFLSPMYNLKRLEDLSKKYGTIDKVPSSEWATHRIWFARMYKYFATWNNLFKKVLSNSTSDLYNFFTDPIKQGATLPHVYQKISDKYIFAFDDSVPPYDPEVDRELDDTAENVLQYKILPFISMPYFLADKEAVQNISFDVPGIPQRVYARDFEILPEEKTKIPFYRNSEPEKNQTASAFYYGYDEQADMFRKMLYWDSTKKDFKPYNPNGSYFIYDKNGHYLEDEKLSNKLPVVSKGKNAQISTFNILDFKTQKDSKSVTIPGVTENTYEVMMHLTSKGILGMPEIAIDKEMSTLTLEYNGKKYCFYLSALYKLLLLRLGLDYNNEPSKDQAIQQFQQLFSLNPNLNLWNDEYFTKDMFLQYHLAELFKNNSALREKVEAVVDFAIPGWQTYQLVLKTAEEGDKGDQADPNEAVFTKKHKLYTTKFIKKYIPGPEQMLAYHFMEGAHYLWFGALNEKAFYETTMEEISGMWSFTIFKTNAEAVKNGDSYISVLQKVFTELKKNTTRKHFISFEGHGWVVSLDEELIKLQNNTPGSAYPTLLKQLPFAGIESWQSSLLPTFYKKKLQDLK